LAIIPATDDIRLSVDIYPDDPRPCTDDTELATVIPPPILLAIIPATDDVKLRLDIYPDDPRP
jgi:tellurite resistance-related uncharacterized protein